MNRSIESERYLEGRSLNEPPFFKNNDFIEWKNKFESYVKSIDQDLWHVILIDDLQLTEINFESKNDYF